jgi:O-antigen biosynthesis protein
MTSIAAIICAYTEERWEGLADAVASLECQTVSPTALIVVIDHNPLLAARARKAFTYACVIENVFGRGLSGARNSGVSVADADVVAFLDDDARATPDWIERLTAHYRDPAVVGVGGAIEPVWVNRRPYWFPREFDWIVGCSYLGIGNEDMPVRNLIGANMSFRRSVFEVVGGFRAGLGREGQNASGCEETELCIRAVQHWPTKNLLYVPTARVYHQVPASRASWRYFQRRCFGEGRAKAFVAQSVGRRDGLSSERNYVTRTLPRGVYCGLLDFTRGDLSGMVRAAAIIAGFAITSVGYIAGALSRAAAPIHAADELDLRRPSPASEGGL